MNIVHDFKAKYRDEIFGFLEYIKNNYSDTIVSIIAAYDFKIQLGYFMDYIDQVHNLGILADRFGGILYYTNVNAIKPRAYINEHKKDIIYDITFDHELKSVIEGYYILTETAIKFINVPF